jgi:recombinational DNA repair protein (RecF pathway)
MSYKTYTTEALVCGSVPHNTSDKSFLLFTREAGMLFASARSVREERSKQRFALQDFSLIRVSLVKGKSGWRIGSVESLGNPFLKAAARKERGRINFIVLQLRRFVQGEEPMVHIFDDVCSLFAHVADEDDVWGAFQTLFLLRLYAHLGYIAQQEGWDVLINASTLPEAYEEYNTSKYAEITQALDRASEASHL